MSNDKLRGTCLYSMADGGSQADQIERKELKNIFSSSFIVGHLD
jgi:hypothetical protein